MALSGDLSTNVYTTSSHGNVGLTLSWTGTQSIANNTTTIKWTLKSYGTMSSGYSVKAGPVSVVIGGKTVLSVSSRFDLYGKGAYKKTGSITVAHNEDGSKSVAMSVKAAIYSTSVNCTGSKTFSLNKINRYALITKYSDFTDTVYPTIEYTNPAGTEMVSDVKIRITWNSGANYTEWFDLADNGSDSPYTFDLDDYIDDMRASCRFSKTLAVQFDMQSTLNNTEYHHTKDALMYIVDANPIIEDGTITYSDTSSVATITGNDQIIVRNKSTLTINVNPDNGNVRPQKSASITALGTSAYSINFNGMEYIPNSSGDVVINTPNMTGEIPAVLKVTDSRGFSSTLTLNIMVYDWQVPSFTYTLERVNGFENETILRVNATFSSVNSINAVTIKEQYRKKGTQTWLPATPETVTNNTDFSINDPTGLDKQYEWEVKITVTDLFYSPSVVEIVEAVGKGVPLFYPDFKRNSIGMNGFADEDNQLFIGEGGHIKADDVKFPMVHSDTEHKVGYWIDGRPIFEQTIELSSAVTIAAGNTSAAGAWTRVQAGWNDEVIILDFIGYSYSGNDNTVWRHLSAQWSKTNKDIRALNVRSVQAPIDAFTIRYIKVTS